MGTIKMRRLTAVVLAGSMMLSLASCQLLGNNNQEIIEAADTFASALVKKSAKKILKLTTQKKSDGFEDLFNKDNYTDDENAFFDAVGDTVSYEIDEESVKAEKEKATIDVVFTMVDYEKALSDGDYSDIGEVVDAIKDCDDMEDIKITFEFEKEDDEWLISNFKDKEFGMLFYYYTYELDLGPDITSLIDYTDGVAGTWYMDFYVYLNGDLGDYAGMITYDVYCDGVLLASDLEASCFDTYIWCTYEDPNMESVPAGEYTFDVKCGGTVFTSGILTKDESYPDPTETTQSTAGMSTSAYQEVLSAYESELRTLENVEYGSMDTCALTDITGDGFPELLIQYCADGEYGVSYGDGSFAVANIRIYTVFPGDTTATEILLVQNSTVNAGGGVYTDVIYLTNGNLLVETNGGDEDWSYSYTEYEFNGTGFTAVNQLNRETVLNYESDDWFYDDYYSINGSSVEEPEFNDALAGYENMFASVLAMDPWYEEFDETTDWALAVRNTQNCMVCYDEAWEITAD